MGWIKTTSKLIKDDLKSDWQFIKTASDRVSAGKPILTDEQTANIKQEFTTGWGDFLKDNWLRFLIIIFAFACGWFIAGHYYYVQCHNYIYETYIITDPLYNITRSGIENFTLNLK